MSDDTPDQSLPAEHDADPLLSAICGFSRYLSGTSDGRKEINITVMVDGLLISGTPISLHEYLLQNDITENFRDQMVRQAGSQQAIEESDLATQYLHLKRAQFFAPGNAASWPPASEAGLWRCKTSSISGFMFGRVGGLDEMTPDESPHKAED